MKQERSAAADNETKLAGIIESLEELKDALAEVVDEYEEDGTAGETAELLLDALESLDDAIDSIGDAIA